MPACRYKKSKQFFSNQSDLPWPFSMLKEAHYIFFTFYDFMIGLIESIKFRVSCQLRLVLGRVIPKNRVSGSLELKNQGKMKHSLQTMFNLGVQPNTWSFFPSTPKTRFSGNWPITNYIGFIRKCTKCEKFEGRDRETPHVDRFRRFST